MDDTIDSVEQLRLQVLANGYTPIRNRDKRTFMRGWPQAVVDEAEIKRWSRRFSRDKATGIRVEDGLAVIDIDVDDRELVDRIANRILDVCPTLEDENVPLLVRRGKGAKEAWFVRTDETFSRIHSRAWVRPGDDVDGGAHRIEIFGGAVARQFGGFGAHTVLDDGSVAIRYVWQGASPADTPKSELPVLTKAQFFAIVDAAEAELKAAGWSPVEKSQKGESDAVRVYDLTDEMQFDLNTGERVSLLELRELAASSDGELRCSASFLEGPTAVNTSRCIVGTSRAGNLTVWESASGVTHSEASAKPRDYTVEIDRIAERLKEIDEKRRNVVKPSDGAAVAATKLLATYAFCPHLRESVVPLWATSMEEGINMMSFRTLMLPNCDKELGPKGGTKTINPVDIWASHEKRVAVRGVRMRPDKPRPTFEEGGAVWVNCYAPPSHEAGGGSAALGLDFMVQIAPDEAERAWLMQWLAYKYRHPHVPGPAVVLVAHGRFGTGRGTLASLMQRLFGSGYVREMPYAMVAGRTYQSQYTDWAADKLMIVVSESSETETGSSAYQTKHNTYEHLKSLIEPNMVERTFISKKGSAFTAMACASYIIASNHADALPIPAEDRRFAVITSGEPRDAAYWDEIRLWMADDANIAAFAAELLAVDLAGYSPYIAPPMTEGKRAMVDASKSDLDRGLDLAFEALVSDVYTTDQIATIMSDKAREYDLGFSDMQRWREIAKREAAKRGHRVGVSKGVNWQPLIDGKRSAVYAVSRSAAARWQLDDRLREEVLKNRALTTSPTERLGNVVVELRSRTATKTE